MFIYFSDFLELYYKQMRTTRRMLQVFQREVACASFVTTSAICLVVEEYLHMHT